MERISLSESFNQSKQDLTISWRILRANWKPFAGTEVFGLISMFILLIAFAIALSGFVAFGRNGNFEEFRQIFSSVSFIRIIIVVLLFYAFLTSQFGLAHDLITSGDMFTEFKSSFHYFRKHWFSYTILTFLTGWAQLLFDQRTILPVMHLMNTFRFPSNSGFDPSEIPYLNFSIIDVIIVDIVTLGVYFLFFLLFISTIPSVTAQGKFLKGIKENFDILKGNFKRLISTWGLYFIIFVIPPIIFDLIVISLNTFIMDTSFQFILNFTTVIVHLVAILIGTPVIALTATRLYNQLYLDNKNIEK